MRRQLERDEPDKLVHRRLGGAQRDHPVARMAGQHRGEIDQPTVAAGNHPRHDGFRQQEGGPQLSVQLAAQLFPGQLGERGDGIRYQRVVHEHVHATPPLIDFAHHAGDITGCGDIGLNRHGLATSRADGRHHLLCLRGTGVIIDDHPKPPLRED